MSEPRGGRRARGDRVSRRACRHPRGGARAQPERAGVRAHPRAAGPHADAHRAGRVLGALVGALQLQAFQADPQDLSHHRPAGGPGARRERRRAAPAGRLGGGVQDRVAQPSVARSSRIRAPRPASAASCAMCSPWARAPSRCSTACGSARSTCPANRYLFAGVVRGVGDYGNCVGVPTLGGEVGFAPGYTGNPARQRDVRRVAARGGPDPRRGPRGGERSPCVGARTGRDGIHGASFASEELSEKSEARRPQVQVGDPFTEKLPARGEPRAHHLGSHRRRSRTWGPPGSPARAPRWRRAVASGSRSTPALCPPARRA